LIEGNSKKSDTRWVGRNSQNKVVVFDKQGDHLQKGSYTDVEIYDCTQATLFGRIKS
jgi:tRNA-2-methylthio-N6-dimethylallyladenosine synthase